MGKLFFLFLLFIFFNDTKPHGMYDTLYLHPDTTTFFNQTVIVVDDIDNIAIKLSVNNGWESYQIEKLLVVIPEASDNNYFEYYAISLGELPNDSIVKIFAVFNSPTYPLEREIVLDTPVVINGYNSFFISGIFNLSISDFIEGGVSGVFAHWDTSQQWIDNFPVYFNIKVVVKKVITNIYVQSLFPLNFILHQNYPNPFNPTTTISFNIPETDFVQLKVFDMLGEEVAMLVNESKSPGNYSVNFNAADLPSGVYIYSLRVNGQVQNRKMLLIK